MADDLRPNDIDEQELNHFWNELVRPSGDRDADPTGSASELTETIRQLHALSKSAPPDAARKRVLRGLHEQLATDRNGRDEPMIRLNTMALPGAFGLNGHADQFPSARSDEAGKHWRGWRAVGRWGFGQLTAAALLLITLGIGYIAFDPFGRGPDTPSSIPAAAGPDATPGTPASAPTPTLYPREGHSIIGAWILDYEPWDPGHNTNIMVFDEDGTVVEYENFSGLIIGRWRATGPRTVEVVHVAQHQESLDYMFEPGFELVQPVWKRMVSTTGWREIEIDESGNTFLATGFYEPRYTDGSIITHLEFDGQPLPGVRMVPIQTPTPTP